MKKLLALTLAAVLLLSLVPFAAAAQFTDAAEIAATTDEAVEILSDLGILAGFPDGAFKPNDTLTRAQAAKILCCVALGTKEAAALSATGSTFSDVPASHWANKFVEYCASKNIVAGVGGGKFLPDGKLTGFAFGKMLLVALGEDASKLVGANWDKAVASAIRAKHMGLGLTVSGEELSRQDACRLALNALFDGEAKDAESTLAYKIFGIKRAAAGNDATYYMRPLVAYTSKTADAYWKGTELKRFASPAYVHENGPLVGDAFVRALGVNKIPKSQITAYYDGVLWNANSSNVKDVWEAGSSGEYYLSGNGCRIELYYDAPKDAYTVVHVYTFTSRIKDVTEPVRNADGTVKTPGSVTFEDGGVCETNDFTKADIGSYALYRGIFEGDLLYYRIPPALKLNEVARGTVVEGVLSDRALRQNVTVDGKTYPYPYIYISRMVTADTYLEEGGAIGDTVKCLLDDYGNCYAIWQ